MPTTPSPENPPLVVRPLDVFDCGGCGQRLRFDARGFVPAAQLDACRGLCDWSPVARGAHTGHGGGGGDRGGGDIGDASGG